MNIKFRIKRQTFVHLNEFGYEARGSNQTL